MPDMRWSVAVVLFALSVVSPATASDPSTDLEALIETIAVSGREERAAEQIVGRLPTGLASRDRLGNVVVTLGSGEPRRLLACGMDEPGLIVTEIRDDGYLRVRPTAGTPSPLWQQGFEGQKVWISTAEGRVPAALAIPSTHLIQDGRPADDIFNAGDAFVDVGAENALEVRAQGIELLDPIAHHQRLTRFGDGLVAGPAAQSRAACAALLAATRGLAAGSVDGSLVLSWVRFEQWNRKGIEHLVGALGPFDEALIASRGFGWKQGENGRSAVDIPEVGTGLLVAGDVKLPGGHAAAHLAPRRAWYTGGPDWGDADKGYFAVPARYRDTPIETVAARDVATLANALVEWAGSGSPEWTSGGDPATEPVIAPLAGHETEAAALAELISAYGVSTREAAVRDAVRARLPDWARPVVDARGNLVVSFGEGEEQVAFVAHLDEVGFAVEEILSDGRLRLGIKGGLSPSAWEGQSAIAHATRGPVKGVFEPRQDWLEATGRRPPGDLTAYLGTNSDEATLALGVAVGDTVTMPKQMRRLGRHRAVARSFDDRVGSTAQLLALERIDPASVKRRLVFAWVVEEEVGLFGTVALADSLAGLDRVHPVDTTVTSDDPYPDKGFALAPLGEGVVLRAMDNGYLAERSAIEHVESVAAARGVPVRRAFTGGGNDGIALIHLGATNMPLSWPGRSSHSPAEIMDFRDLEALVDLIVALVEE